jgi:hypothetical protein
MGLCETVFTVSLSKAKGEFNGLTFDDLIKNFARGSLLLTPPARKFSERRIKNRSR